MAKIYSITISNALDGVAWACRACAIESQRPGSACVPCPAGYYIDEETNQCQECPPNTFLSGHHIYGRDACQPCGPGGRSNKVLSMLLPARGYRKCNLVNCSPIFNDPILVGSTVSMLDPEKIPGPERQDSDCLDLI